MADLGLGAWESVNVGETGLAQAAFDAVKDGSPVIVACVWDGGGGHALVIDETFSFFGRKYLAVCDPWDGELHIVSCTTGATVRYDTGDTPISTGTLFGGSARAGTGIKGKFDGRIVRRK